MFSPTVSEIEFDPYVLVAQMLQKLELAIGSFRENWGAERLHDLFDCHGLTGQLIFCRTEQKLSTKGGMHGDRGVLTRPVQKLPCPLAASRCTCLSINHGRFIDASDGGTIFDLPAGYLERCTKNLGTYEFCHAGEDRMHSVGR